jgi:glycosyltransferase involved in cell wall biosynthesis
MIRVGFILTFRDQGWLGGINYFRNLLTALQAMPGCGIEPVLLTGPDTDQTIIGGFPRFETVVAPELRQSGPAWIARRAGARLLRRDLPLAGLASRLGLRLVSHHGFLGSIGRVPLLGWIPDFQELHLPEFFSGAELRARARKVRQFCRDCRRILLSSESARADLATIDPRAAAEARVLRFVAAVPPQQRVAEERVQRLGIAGPYFHLPNQFWAHKNHRIVVDALAILKRRGHAVLVLATGNPNDHRQPGYFNELMAHVERAGVGNQFRCLGTLPYEDLMALMRASRAVINPSLFEGWSTTVEEAKSLGKHAILSDLPVHREQAPPRGTYFDPHDPEGLADKLWLAWTNLDAAEEERAAATAASKLPERRMAFAREYESVVRDVVGVACGHDDVA